MLKGIDLKQFSPDAQDAFSQAQEAATELKQQEVRPLHLAMALFGSPKGAGRIMFANDVANGKNFNPERIVQLINSALTAQSGPSKKPYGSVVDNDLQTWAAMAQLSQSTLGHEGQPFNSADLLYAMFWSSGIDMVINELNTQGFFQDNMVETFKQTPVTEVKSRRTKRETAQREDILKKYGKNLVAEMRTGDHDPVIGRDIEVLHAEEILSRKTKNNPVLLGEPGVGKTAIVEGLAQRIASGDVPTNLKNKRLIELDLTSMTAGASHVGEFEERFKNVLAAIEADSEHMLVFIDEIHMIMGAGQSGTMDAGNMLKPLLARGKLHLIGATTNEEYKKYMEKDKALTRRFQIVNVDEPTTDDAITILRGLRERFEIHHGVRIHDGALVAAVKLSDRYINDRYLPDKAIDLVDSACAAIRVALNSAPPALDEAQRQMMRLKVEEVALKQESDHDSKQRLKTVQKQKQTLQQKVKTLSAQWNQEKGVLQQASSKKAELDKARHDLAEAETHNDVNRAADLETRVIPGLEAEIEAIDQNDSNVHLISESVTADEIAKVVGDRTGIPVTKLVEGEQDKLVHLGDELHQSIIGQEEAVNAVVKTVWRSRAGIQDPTKPLGSFLFLGPTGVGKTALAKALALALFDSEDALLRFDMSEYMEPESVQSLIGAAPGYVGYEEGGKLTEAVRHKPYSIVLFDEVEKAHPDIFNILLQVLDDGRLTDNHDRTVDFKNTIIVLTSNLAADVILKAFQEHHRILDSDLVKIEAAERTQFRPELLNRLSHKIIFHPLTLQNMVGIVQYQIGILIKRLSTEQQIGLTLTDNALNWLAKTGYDPANGARPVSRLITNEIEDRLAGYIISGKLKGPGQVVIGVKDDQLKFKMVSQTQPAAS